MALADGTAMNLFTGGELVVDYLPAAGCRLMIMDCAAAVIRLQALVAFIAITDELGNYLQHK